MVFLISAAGGVVLGVCAAAAYSRFCDERRFKGDLRGAFDELADMGLFERETRGEQPPEAPAEESQHSYRVGAGGR